MFFDWFKRDDAKDEKPVASAELRKLVASAMSSVDADSVLLVGAVAGLLATVAYADRAYGEEEQLAVEDALRRVHELRPEAIPAITALLRSRIRELASEPLHDYTRALVAITDRHARLELLDTLLDVAAADLVLSMDETNLLRRVARLLGLSDDDYLASQTRHRARLSVLNAPHK